MELEDLLYLVLLDDFGVDAQDGSVVWASKILCELYRDCFKNNHFSGLEELLRRREAVGVVNNCVLIIVEAEVESRNSFRKRRNQ